MSSLVFFSCATAAQSRTDRLPGTPILLPLSHTKYEVTYGSILQLLCVVCCLFCCALCLSRLCHKSSARYHTHHTLTPSPLCSRLGHRLIFRGGDCSAPVYRSLPRPSSLQSAQPARRQTILAAAAAATAAYSLPEGDQIQIRAAKDGVCCVDAGGVPPSPPPPEREGEQGDNAVASNLVEGTGIRYGKHHRGPSEKKIGPRETLCCVARRGRKQRQARSEEESVTGRTQQQQPCRRQHPWGMRTLSPRRECRPLLCVMQHYLCTYF